MPKKIVWSSELTTSMVKGWSDDAVAELVQALDEAVERVIDDITSEYEVELSNV